MAGGIDDLDEGGVERLPRDSKGRFPKGVSGNPLGRRMQLRRDPKLPASRRRVISDVADKQIDVTVDGEKRRMGLFEANVHAIAVAGAKGSRVAAQKFVDLMIALADTDLERRLATRELMEQMNEVADENARLKAQHGSDGGVLVVGMEKMEEWYSQRHEIDERHLDDAESVEAFIGRSPRK